MRKLTNQDVVAANFRNAFVDAMSSVNIMNIEDDLDAKILESCYKKTDEMTEDNINLYATCISMGFELKYEPQSDDFIVITH